MTRFAGGVVGDRDPQAFGRGGDPALDADIVQPVLIGAAALRFVRPLDDRDDLPGLQPADGALGRRRAAPQLIGDVVARLDQPVLGRLEVQNPDRQRPMLQADALARAADLRQRRAELSPPLGVGAAEVEDVLFAGCHAALPCERIGLIVVAFAVIQIDLADLVAIVDQPRFGCVHLKERSLETVDRTDEELLLDVGPI